MHPWLGLNPQSATDLSYIILNLLDDAGLHSCFEKAQRDLKAKGLLNEEYTHLKSVVGPINWESLLTKLTDATEPKPLDSLYNLKKSVAHLLQPISFARQHRSLGMQIPGRSHPKELIHKLRPLKVNVGHQSPICTIIYSKDGEYIFTGADDKLVKQWSVHTGHLIATLRGHCEHVNDLAAANSDMVISCSNHIRVWRTEDAYPAKVFPTTSEVKRVLFYEDSIFVSTSKDGTCKFWDLNRDPSEACFATFTRTPKQIIDMDLDQIHNFFENAGFRELIGQIEDIDGEQLRHIGRAKARMKSELSTNDLNRFLDKLRVLKNKRSQDLETMSCAVCPKYDEVCVGYSDGSFQRLSVSKEMVLEEHELHLHEVEEMMYSHSGLWLVTASEEGLIRFLKRSSCSCEQMTLQHTIRLEEDIAKYKSDEKEAGGVAGLAFSKYDQFFICSIHPEIIRVYRMNDCNVVPLWDLPMNGLNRICVHPEFPILCVADQVVAIWDLQAGQQIALWQLQSHLRAVLDVAWSPDGTQLALCTVDGSFCLFGLGDRSNYTRIPKEQFFASDYNPLKYDTHWTAMDQLTEEAPHMMDKILVNQEGEPYDLDLLRNYAAFDEYDIIKMPVDVKAECIEPSFETSLVEEMEEEPPPPASPGPVNANSDPNETLSTDQSQEIIDLSSSNSGGELPDRDQRYIMDDSDSDSALDADDEYIPNMHSRRERRRVRRSSPNRDPPRSAVRDLGFVLEPVDAPYIPPEGENLEPASDDVEDTAADSDLVPLTRSQARRRRASLELDQTDQRELTFQRQRSTVQEEEEDTQHSPPLTRARRKRISEEAANQPTFPVTRLQRRRQEQPEGDSDDETSCVAESAGPMTRSQRRLRGLEDLPSEVPQIPPPRKRRRRRNSREEPSEASSESEESATEIPPILRPPPRKRRKIMRNNSSTEEKNIVYSDEADFEPYIRRSQRRLARRKISYTEDDPNPFDAEAETLIEPRITRPTCPRRSPRKRKRKHHHLFEDDLEISEQELVNEDSTDSDEITCPSPGKRRSKRLRKRTPVNYDQTHYTDESKAQEIEYRDPPIFDLQTPSPASLPYHLNGAETPNEFYLGPENSSKELLNAVSWLLQSKRRSGSYVPQIGDSVVYHVSLHREVSGPTEDNGSEGTTLPPILECSVLDISFKRLDGNVSCVVTLGNLQSSDPFATKIPETKTCTIVYPPTNNNFLIPSQVYHCSLSQTWVIGDRCRVAYVEEGELQYYKGVIRENNKQTQSVGVEFDGYKDKLESHKYWELEKESLEDQAADEKRFTWPSICQHQPQLQQLLDSLKNMDPHRTFIDVPDFRVYWDYLLRIDVPIWLDLIEQRVKNNYYTSLKSFMFDIDLLVHNGRKYNTKNPAMVELVESMLKEATEFTSLNLCS